jgi:GntR family transcriptional repressor for pyruvate dehydrogenase complex
LEGIGFAFELMQGDTLLEVMEVRRMLEPAATRLAAARMTVEHVAALSQVMAHMRDCMDDAEQLLQLDIAFHRMVIQTVGNETLTSLLDGLSGRTARARIWRGIVEGNVAQHTIDEHQAILSALRSHDQQLAYAAALMHVNTSEAWLRAMLHGQPLPRNHQRPPSTGRTTRREEADLHEPPIVGPVAQPMYAARSTASRRPRRVPAARQEEHFSISQE